MGIKIWIPNIFTPAGSKLAISSFFFWGELCRGDSGLRGRKAMVPRVHRDGTGPGDFTNGNGSCTALAGWVKTLEKPKKIMG